MCFIGSQAYMQPSVFKIDFARNVVDCHLNLLGPTGELEIQSIAGIFGDRYFINRPQLLLLRENFNLETMPRIEFTRPANRCAQNNSEQ